MNARVLESTLPCLIAAAALPCQTIHQVGLGGFLTIDAAIQAAAPGDIVLVGSGLHSAFTLTKGLTIRGTGSTQILTFGPIQPTANIPFGQTAHLTDLQFTTFACSGHLTLDRCTFTGSPPRLAISNAVVHLQRCAVTGTSSILFPASAPTSIVQSDVFASNCSFSGVDGLPNGTSAITLSNSSFHGSDLAIASGTGTTSAPAFVADAISEVALSDSTISSVSGPCPLVASNGRLARCTLSPSCSPLPVLPMLGISRVVDIFLGGNLAVDFLSAPGDIVFVWAALELAPMSAAFLTGPLLLPPTTAFPAAILVADASGRATGVWPIPFNPAIRHQGIWLQGLQGTTFPLTTSVAAGGLPR